MWPGALEGDHRSMHPFQYTELAREHRDELLAEAGRRRLIRLVRNRRDPDAA